LPREPTDSVLARGLFRARLWLGARMLPMRIAGKDFAAMLQMFEPKGMQRTPQWSLDYLERSVRWAVRGPILMRDRRCLRSGLLGYAALKAAGYAPELRFSIDRKSVATNRLAAHCWVCVDGVPIINQPLPDHVVVFTHGATTPTKADV
jgi:hypothetical protein